MKSTVTAHLDITAQQDAEMIFLMAVARSGSLTSQDDAGPDSGITDESLTVRHESGEPDVTVYTDDHGTQVHRIWAPKGSLTVSYQATASVDQAPTEPTPVELMKYSRPSRYCQSDVLAASAYDLFHTYQGLDLIDAVEAWVYTRIAYVSGSTGPTDGASDIMLTRQGVCRDYAHLVIALLRARDIPARFAAVYAPGLNPMDFHAVVEAYVDGSWHLIDATRLAPRESMVRIATGRDAADTAFMTSSGGGTILNSVEVTAVAQQLPPYSATSRVALA